MTIPKQNPKRRWQNLLHLKCPNCNERLEDSKLYLCCPTPHETEVNKSCFFIKKTRVAEILLDENHPAHFCLTEEERARIDEVIKQKLTTEEE